MGREEGGGTPRESLLDSKVGQGGSVARLVDVRRKKPVAGASGLPVKPTIGPVGESALLNRLRMFLPEMEAANAKLEAEMAAVMEEERQRVGAEQKERERRGVVSMGLAEDDAGARVSEAVRRHFDVEAVDEGEAYVEVNLMPIPDEGRSDNDDSERHGQEDGDKGEIALARGVLKAHAKGVDMDDRSSSSEEDEPNEEGGRLAKRAKLLVTELDDKFSHKPDLKGG